MKLRMESTVSENGRERNFPATVPPIKIKVKKKKKKFSKKNYGRKNISYRIYLCCFCDLIDAIAIAVKLTNIQWVEGSYYRQLAKRTVRILLFLPKAIFILQMEVY
jgi:uncharacterized protein YpuA (DUF1002 family)